MLAVTIGCAIELSLVVSAFVFGRFGPCGPANVFAAILMVLHLPGILLSSPVGAMEVRPGTEIIRDSLAFLILGVTSVTTFAAVAYAFTRRLRPPKK